MEEIMKVGHRETLSFPPGPLTRNPLSAVAARVNDVFGKVRFDSAEKENLSYWQFVFLQSKVNSCSYRGEALPHAKWQWPRDTWFQDQLEHRLKSLELAGHQTRN